MTLAIKKMTLGNKSDRITAEPTVAAGFAKALVDLAISKGANRQELLRRANVRFDDLLDQDNRVTLMAYLRLLEEAKELCQEPALSLQFGEKFRTSELSIVGLICEAAETAAEAFSQMGRYSRLVLDTGHQANDEWFEITRDEAGEWLELKSNLYQSFPQLTESAFARCVTESTRFLGRRLILKAVHFTHGEPSYRTEFDRIFNTTIVFESDRNALLFDNADRPEKLSTANRYVFGIFNNRADTLLENLESSKSVRGSVEAVLMPILHTGALDMELIARKLGMSRQTLYRKLKIEGTSFTIILDELRHDLARIYLESSKISVNETAYLLGYTNPSVFSRAFKRWTGSSPTKMVNMREPKSVANM